MSIPLISVVTPSWNQGEYLADCLQSCLEGEEGEIEHIVVDNESDDSTHQVLREFPHVQTIIEKDRGQSDALNKGIQAARGKWILWLNADDFVTPNGLQSFLKLARADTSYDAVYGHMMLVDKKSNVFRRVYQASWSPWMARFGVFALPSTGTLFRASLLREFPLSEDFHMVMDSEWCLRTMGKVSSRRLQEFTVAFRVTETNKTGGNIMSGEITPRHLTERKVLAEKYPYYGREGETDRSKAFYLWAAFLRKAGRYVVLADKFFSKLRGIK